MAPLEPEDKNDKFVTAEDMSRWEEMYFDGEASKKKKQDADDLLLRPNSISCPIRVVSFDLDNTLWKTGPTIAGANDALAEYLESKDIVVPVRIEKVMGQLFKQSKSTYAPNDDAKAPTQLTKLRKDALRHAILEEEETQAPTEVLDNIDDVVEEAFQIWTTRRHELIPVHFASDVVDTLKKVRSIDTNLLIGAITDGNSDPRSIAILEPYFDFVVNAENVGVSKPDPALFLAAIREALQTSPSLVNDIFKDRDLSLISDELLEDSMGPWWVHVGDDFVKDMVAGRSLKMRCIWSKELVLDKTNSTADNEQPNKSKMTLQDFVLDMSKKGLVINMEMGGEDYLAKSMQEDYVDGVCDRFDQVGNMLRTWHLEGLVSRSQANDIPETTRVSASASGVPTTATGTHSTTAKQPSVSGKSLPQDDASISEPTLSGATAATVATPMAGNEVDAPNGAASKSPTTKFCMYCGTKLPAVAKFCSSCGEKQPELP